MSVKPGMTLRHLSRREVMALLGVVGGGWLTGASLFPRRTMAATAVPSCTVRPEQTEGPYFIDEQLNRSDIRSDPSSGRVTPGIPLILTLRVSRLSAKGCRPLSGALVDVWHCDARGIYSGVEDPWFNTVGQKFLRGCQITGATGEARFVTIYPGWYPGRTVHIHFKIRTTPIRMRSAVFTSQLYFDDALTDHVHANPPYASRGPRAAHNRHDHIFRHGGDRLMLAPTADAEGYAAAFSLGLDLP